ncbi:hypothetical protein FSP39_021392 [Pinctada imbricata]|uniref:Nucleosome-remodeling factor subunit BPTF n=1 Tax=Pinctada imbricata TaxID=66713 RepID=A0AA88XTU2_PINIB|nr:hypothetical protein FSP39_021392 [Pinctada imbricata]
MNTLMMTIVQLENNLPGALLHPNWPLHRNSWNNAVQKCRNPADFALALTILEACIKPVLFNPVWNESLGHSKLHKITLLEREEMKKKEKEYRKLKEEEEVARGPLVWIKYTLGLKHQVWKQKGEEYRVTGGQGWVWISKTRKSNPVSQEDVGLRGLAKKLRARKFKFLVEKPEETLTDNKQQSIEEDDCVNDVKPSADVVKKEMAEDESESQENKAEVSMDATDIKQCEEIQTKQEKMETEEISVNGDIAENSDRCNSKSDTQGQKEGMDVDVESTSPVKKPKLEEVKEEEADQKESTKSSELDITKIKVKHEVENSSSIGSKSENTTDVNKYGSYKDVRLAPQILYALDLVDLKSRKVLLSDPSPKKEEKKEPTDKSEEEQSEEEEDADIENSRYKCYSYMCRGKDNFQCYSPLCMMKFSQDEAMMNLTGTNKLQEDEEEESEEEEMEEEEDDSNSVDKDDEDDNREEEDVDNDEDEEIDVEGDVKSSPLKAEIKKEKTENDDENIEEMEDEIKKDDEEVKDVTMENDEEIKDAGKESDEEMKGTIKEEDEEMKDDSKEEKEDSKEEKDDSKEENETVDVEGVKEEEDGNIVKTEGEEPMVTDTVVKQEETESESSEVTTTVTTTTTTTTVVKTETVTMTTKAIQSGAVDGATKVTLTKIPNTGNAVIPQALLNKAKVKTGNLTMTQAQLALRQAISRMSVDELRSKMPPIRHTKEAFKLVKFAKLGQKPAPKKKASLPSCHKFLTPSGIKTMFALEPHELKKMARKGGRFESKCFNYNCKMNNVNWIYPCPRPLFKTCWRYRTQTLRTFAAIGIQLRILWACIRWDDMNVKPPAGGTNTISTETEITTKELLKRRDVGPHNLRSEFLVRTIVVPLGLPAQPKEKYTPQRSGLRERKRADSPKQTEPSVIENWTPEEELELWEIKQFGEKLAKQRAAIQEKTTQDQVQLNQANALQLKAQLEQQLKQQRLALQQKRLLEAQGVVVTTATTNSGLLTATLNSTSGGTIIKTTSSNTSLLAGATSILKTVPVQPKTIITSTGLPVAGQLGSRPVIRVNVPRPTIQLQSSNGVTLAPKPWHRSYQYSVLSNQVITPQPIAASTPTRLVLPGQVTTDGAPKVQIRTSTPVVRPAGATGQQQNLQIIQGPSGQLQVRGLLPGQQIIRLPDGRLQLLTMPQNPSAATPTVVTTTTPSSVTSVLTQPKGQMTIRPAGSIVVSNSGTVSANPSQASPARIVVPASSLTAASGAPVIPSAVTTQIVSPALKTVTPSVNLLSSVQSAASSLPNTPKPTIIAGTSLASLSAPRLITTQANPTSSVGTLGSGVAALLTNNQSTPRPILVANQSVVQTSSGVALSLPTSMPFKISPKTTTISAPTQQLIVQTQKPTGAVQPMTLTEAQKAVPSNAVIASTQTAAAAPTKYAVTPQVVQQVVRQALMQNQTPEIQAKLLAMQRMMQNPQAVTTPTVTLEEKAPVIHTIKTPAVTVKESLDSQKIPPEQKEDKMRRAVCAAVLKSMVEKIERKEKDELRKVKKQEIEEEKQKRTMVAKLHGTLFKHKEALKKEILKKRSFMEKNLHQEIQLEVAEQLKLRQPNLKKAEVTGKGANQALLCVQQHLSVRGNQLPIPPMPPSSLDKPKRKKQKIISTGAGRSINPKSRLYCVCKQPYDETKFYIGCDLCSNWFHGACVNISEHDAKHIDSYICEDCRKQRETATEELYCLCKTPYDDTQFYIGCDRCQDWFHGRCVGVSQVEADHMDTYICPNCDKKEKADPISQKILSEKDYESLKRLVRSLQSHKMAWPFLEPVDPDEVPDYYAVIKDPMDLQTVEKRVGTKQYPRLADFVKDVTKVFDNCRLYNPPDTPFYQCAEVLETFFVQRLKSVKERI